MSGTDSARDHARRREDELLELLASHIGAEVLDRPEQPDTQFPGLNTDGVLETQEGHRWSVDITALADDAQLSRCFDAADAQLGALATEHGVALSVEIEAQTTINRMARAVEVELNRQGQAGSAGTNGWAARWSPSAVGSVNPVIVTRGTLTGNSSDSRTLDERMKDDLLPVFLKKRRQAQRSANHGLPYGLVIDGDGHPGIRQGTHWLSQGTESRQYAIWKACQESSIKVDGVLLALNNSLFPIAGRWGRTTFALPAIA